MQWPGWLAAGHRGPGRGDGRGIRRATESQPGRRRHPRGVRSELQSNAIKLAALQPPAGVDPALAGAIRSFIVGSFLYGFRLVMWICAALALTSAAVTWRMIPASARRVADSVSPAANFVASGPQVRVE